MAYDKKTIQKSNPFKSIQTGDKITRTVYYAEVISVEDPTDGGRIKVRIEKFDGELSNDGLPWAYPLLPKFFHIYPKIGELVRIFIEDIKYPERGRFWMGSIISQPQKFWFDSLYTAGSTTDMALTRPEKAVSTFPDAKGVFPEKEDIALIGRNNTDVVLKDNQLIIRTGKHEKDKILKLNTKNPASLIQTLEEVDDKLTSSTIINSDKIALISHDGIPKFKAARIDLDERERIFNDAHPMVRGDVLVEALKLIRRAITLHIHGYNALPADRNTIISDLESIDFESMLQKNILIN
jgi:hypothetical protein